MITPVLETERLILRPLSVEDTKQWLLMEEEKVFELGYNIMHKYWNQGYTTEAAKGILEFAKNELGQKEFIAKHAVDNPASGAVMQKCGFIYEKDGITTKFDGVTTHQSKCYRLKL